jgi:hypothetical protein
VLRATLIAALLWAACLPRSSVAAEWYVSPVGDDHNDGSRERPWKTFAAAQQAVRASKARGTEPITVWFAAGSFYLPEPIVFTSADSGTASAPVTYASAGGGAIGGQEAAVLSGGERLEGLKWTPHAGAILKASVPAELKTDQLFVGGERQILARYPNFDPSERIFNGFAADALSPERAKNWANPTGGFIHAMHRHEWGDYRYRITGKDAAGKLDYEGGWQNNRQMGMHPERRMVEGIFEELDAPGEWFLDERAHVLYFYPPTGMSAEELERAVVEAVRLRELVRFQGSEQEPVHHVALRGFTLRHTAHTFMDTKEPLLRSDWMIYRGGAVMFAGAEDCGLDDCFLDQVGGNAVFVSNYNRRVAIRGCQIAEAGASGIALVGDPAAVRNPLFEYNERHDFAALDRTPGPKTGNYPADCLIEQCLIYRTGRAEKQTAPVQIAMAQGIKVRHCSLYDVPRAGVNIGDGCWGGHLIEHCDVFDTVQETGDHGSFNSWGRDRYWDREREIVDAEVGKDAALSALDMVKPTTLRNNRWRCDHGWDIDLDDGSSAYVIENNVCLSGGLKFREGYRRRATNNILFRNTFHPHVWYAGSGDVFARNIVMSQYQPIGMPKTWGAEIDYNLLPDEQALAESQQAGRDQHSQAGDPQFFDAAHGDFQVQAGSPALALGFRNFPMDQFGVTKPALRAIARTPSFGERGSAKAAAPVDDQVVEWLGAKVKNVTTEGERSAAGLPEVAGVLLVDVPTESPAALAGLRKMDVVTELNKQPIRSVRRLRRLTSGQPAAAELRLGIVRDQQPLEVLIRPK